ncbi:hypothetical protein ACHAWF_008553 [Thalassiosira exigua]
MAQPTDNSSTAVVTNRKNETDITPCAEDVAASIVSDAERSAQSELRSTSEILKLAGCILRDRAGSVGGTLPTKTTIQFSPMLSPGRSGSDDSGSLNCGTGIMLPQISIETALPSSPRAPPPTSPTFDDSIHLPGKFGSLSSAEVKQKLTSSPIKRTELLSKLDGLDRVVPSSNNTFSNENKGAGHELVGKVARSSSAVSAAMQNAHAHANRIKNMAKKSHPRPQGITIGNSIEYSSMQDNSSSSLSSLAIDKSMHTRGLLSSKDHEHMPLWAKRKIAAEKQEYTNCARDPSEYFGQYEIHLSETIISHEFSRGDWTWATEWSPDGQYLALATENHGLAIVEAGISTVWKVIHDERIGKVKNDSTHAIRSIAWGGNFIALGGTGDAVSIVEPSLSSSSLPDDASVSSCGSSKRYSFDVVDRITETGFVGALSWLKNSNILAIGNREDQCLIAEVRRGEDGTVTSNVLHKIERSDWCNAVKFSHGGTKLAIGDRSGLLSVYLFVMIRPGEAPALSPLHDIPLEDNILDIQWSPEGKFLYTGGEDYSITVLDTAKYTILHKIGRDCWVNFVAPSRGGSYLAAGGYGVVSLFEVDKKWEDVTSLPVDGGMALSATWHPNDEHLSVCGQFNDVVVYEASCRRLPKGKCLRSKSSIVAVDVSPDEKMIAVGNETGLVTVFDASCSAFATIYETVIGSGGDMSMRWSPDGQLAITSGCTFVLLDTYSGEPGRHPESSAKFLVRKVIQGGSNFTCISISPNSRFIALAGDETRILDIKNDCSCVQVLDESNAIDQSYVIASAWSDDVFAMVGERPNLSTNLYIYDANEWELLFSIAFKVSITSLCLGPSVSEGLHYLAFGGENETVSIIEFRTHKRTWETVLQIPCESITNDLAWNDDGLLCIGDDNGTASVVDLSYLKSGNEVGEMSYNWQRQGVISATKLSRNFGRNAITSVCWIPPGSLAIGGSDGIVEIVDWTLDAGDAATRGCT